MIISGQATVLVLDHTLVSGIRPLKALVLDKELGLLVSPNEEISKTLSVYLSHLQEVSRLQVIINAESLSSVESQLWIEQPVELLRIELVVKGTSEVLYSILIIIIIIAIVIVIAVNLSLSESSCLTAVVVIIEISS